MKKLSIAIAAALGLAMSPVMAQETGAAGDQAGTTAQGGLSTTGMVAIGAAAVAAIAVVADSSSDEEAPTTTVTTPPPTQTQTQTTTVTVTATNG